MSRLLEFLESQDKLITSSEERLAYCYDLLPVTLQSLCIEANLLHTCCMEILKTGPTDRINARALFGIKLAINGGPIRTIGFVAARLLEEWRPWNYAEPKIVKYVLRALVAATQPYEKQVKYNNKKRRKPTEAQRIRINKRRAIMRKRGGQADPDFVLNLLKAVDLKKL